LQSRCASAKREARDAANGLGLCAPVRATINPPHQLPLPKPNTALTGSRVGPEVMALNLHSPPSQPACVYQHRQATAYERGSVREYKASDSSDVSHPPPWFLHTHTHKPCTPVLPAVAIFGALCPAHPFYLPLPTGASERGSQRDRTSLKAAAVPAASVTEQSMNEQTEYGQTESGLDHPSVTNRKCDHNQA